MKVMNSKNEKREIETVEQFHELKLKTEIETNKQTKKKNKNSENSNSTVLGNS